MKTACLPERIPPSIQSQRAFWPPIDPPTSGAADDFGPRPVTIVGLDTSRAPVRMVIATSGPPGHLQGFSPWPEESETFDCLRDFARYWTESNLGPDIRVAVPKDRTDPLGVRAWLDVQGQVIEEYEWMAYRSHLTKDLELRDMDLDERYQRPYALALYAAYRLRAGWVARGLWAKAYEAFYLLIDLKHEIHRLAAALPEPSPSP